MPDAPPDEGTIIQVTRDVPAPNPKFVVDDSPLKASIITIFSLVFFGISLFGALMRLASAGDLNAIRALLLRDDTIGWLTSVATLLAPTFWLAWRTVRSWFKKTREVEIVQAAPNAVAMLKSEVAPAAEPAASPPTRARETATPTRLVDGSVLLHRGGYAAPAGDPGSPPTGGTVVSKPASTYDGGAPSPTVIAGVDVSHRDPAPAADTAPRIPGDALNAPLPPADGD